MKFLVPVSHKRSPLLQRIRFAALGYHNVLRIFTLQFA
jgi:hypothetical protein